MKNNGYTLRFCLAEQKHFLPTTLYQESDSNKKVDKALLAKRVNKQWSTNCAVQINNYPWLFTFQCISTIVNRNSVHVFCFFFHIVYIHLYIANKKIKTKKRSHKMVMPNRLNFVSPHCKLCETSSFSLDPCLLPIQINFVFRCLFLVLKDFQIFPKH